MSVVNLTLCSYITSNIKESQFEFWLNTAKKWGYNYRIIGRNETWKNKSDWGRRTKSYIDFLEKEKDDNGLYLLTDSTDVLFSGYPDELIEKFTKLSKKYNSNVIISGEFFPSFIIKNHTIYENIIAEKAHGRNMYPNCGMIMGYKKDLLEIYKKISNEKNDQLGILKLICNNKNILVDCKSELFLNIPLYHVFKHNELFEYHISNGRVFDSNGLNPCVIHFPGSVNNFLIKKYYNGIMKENNVKYQLLDSLFAFPIKKFLLNVLVNTFILVLVIIFIIILIYFFELKIKNITIERYSISHPFS